MRLTGEKALPEPQDTLWALHSDPTVSRGPSNDSPQFPEEAVRQAAQNVHFDRLLVDAAHDAERNHRLCRWKPGICLFTPILRKPTRRAEAMA